MLVELDLARDRGATLQRQIVEQLRAAILKGRLEPGAELPSSRELSEQYGVARNTVVQAYETLAGEGYVVSRRGGRTRVASPIPDDCLGVPAPAAAAAQMTAPAAGRRPDVVFRTARPALPSATEDGTIDFWPGRANRRLFPIAAWRRLADEALAGAPSGLVEYNAAGGLAELRQAIADHVASARGIRAGADAVIVTAGVQEALNIVARLLVSDGVGVAIENPGYGSAALVFESHGARLVPTLTDSEGVIVDRLPESGVSLAYVTPSHQFPTGVAMSAARRDALLDWSRRTGAYVFEDDYDSDYSFSGPPLVSLAGRSDGDGVIYASTLSKALGAGVRAGYIVLPPELVEPALTIKTLANYGHPWLEQAILARFLSSGAYRRHLREIRRRCADLLGALGEQLTRAFGPVELSGAHNGMHVMWTLPADLPDAEPFAERALAAGTRVYTLERAGAFDAESGFARRNLLLGYAALTEREIAAGVEAMRRAAEARPVV
ncbi:MAG: transcriptional regulator [Ancylobacter novellus]|uniref:Transcriptional regulator n=1 Tax=Ancylobacter novellus TaxID=921 RepID=A0A2W5MQN6_ANCNO|nr:MAG: transcriptional regulator [Ancylobacter novellus]